MDVKGISEQIKGSLHSTKKKVCTCYCQSDQAPTAGELIDANGELTTIILLSGHSYQLPSKFASLYP